MSSPDISNRGVYYNLEISPYVYTNAYGDSFKFSSQKKLDMYTRDIETAKSRYYYHLRKLNQLCNLNILPIDNTNTFRSIYYKLYEKIEGVPPCKEEKPKEKTST